jgi:hypothetical protein
MTTKVSFNIHTDCKVSPHEIAEAVAAFFEQHAFPYTKPGVITAQDSMFDVKIGWPAYKGVRRHN